MDLIVKNVIVLALIALGLMIMNALVVMILYFYRLDLVLLIVVMGLFFILEDFCLFLLDFMNQLIQKLVKNVMLLVLIALMDLPGDVIYVILIILK